MKLVEKPIKLAAVFSPNGKVTPVSFVFGNCKYKVTLIQSTWRSRSLEYSDILHFRLQVLGPDRQERVCEVAFVQEEMRWVLVKI